MKKFNFTVILFCVAFSLFSLDSDDFTSTAATSFKVILPLTMIPEMINDSDSIIPGVIGLGLFSAPNSFLLYNVLTENPVGTTFWRNITMYTDAVAGVSILGSGVYLLAGFGNDPGGWDPLVGGIFVAISALVFGAVGLDTVPYTFE